MASGDICAAWFGSQGVITPTTGAPVLYDSNSGYSMRAGAGNDVECTFPNFLENYAGGGLTLRIWYAMSAANTTDALVFAAAFQNLGVAADVSSVTWDENTETQTVPDAAWAIGTAEILFADGVDMDSIADGSPFRLRLRVLGSDGASTAAGDCWVFALKLIEQ